MSTKPLAYFEAVLAGRPVPWQRTHVTDGGKRLTNIRYRQWKTEAAAKLEAFARWRTLAGDVAVTITVHPDGVTVRAASLDDGDPRRPSGIRGDLDNYTKAVLDALQDAGVLTDDRQIVDIAARFDPNPRPKATP